MSNRELSQNTGQGRSEGFKIDFKRVVYRMLQHWYVLAVSLAVSLSIAFLKNRYAVRIYPVTASIVIREKEEPSGGELLYSNSLVNPYRNYLNEPYIIRSYPLIEKVVKELNFEVAFFQEGNIKTTETYRLPVKVKLLTKNGSYGKSLVFKVLDEKNISIKKVEDKDKNKEMVFHFIVDIRTLDYHFLVVKDSLQKIDKIKDVPYLLTFLNPLAVTGGYVGRLNVLWAEEGAGIINLAINGPSPEKEIDFMNGLINTYQRYDLEKKNQTAERTIQFIQDQLTGISDSLKIFEGQLQQFKISNSIDKLDDEAKRLFDKLTPLESQKTELIIRSNYYEYLVKYINGGKNLDLIIIPSTVGVNDGVLSGLVNKMIDIQLDLKLFMGNG